MDGEGGSGCGGLVAAFVMVAILAIVGASAVLVTDGLARIEDARADRARAAAAIEYERTRQIAEREDGKTERFQSFQLGLTALTAIAVGQKQDTLFGLLFVGLLALDVVGVALVWRDLRGRGKL